MKNKNSFHAQIMQIYEKIGEKYYTVFFFNII